MLRESARENGDPRGSAGVNEERKALIRYRLEQADEAVRCARMMLDHGMPRPSVNRSYYAMFYGVLALLAAEGKGTSKHSGAMSLFDRDFVRNGLFGEEFSDWLHEAFDLRHRADCRDMFEVSSGLAQSVLDHAVAFVAAVKARLARLASDEEDPR